MGDNGSEIPEGWGEAVATTSGEGQELLLSWQCSGTLWEAVELSPSDNCWGPQCGGLQ